MILLVLAGFGQRNTTLEEGTAASLRAGRSPCCRIVPPLTRRHSAGAPADLRARRQRFIPLKLLERGRVLLLATEIYDQAAVVLNFSIDPRNRWQQRTASALPNPTTITFHQNFSRNRLPC